MLCQKNDELKSLLSETWNSAFLDIGASSAVSGIEWFKQYRDSITESDKNQICFNDSKRPCIFEDRKKLQAIKSAKVPALIGSKWLCLLTDIVNANIPLLLSKASMKNCNIKIDFVNDTINVFGEIIPVSTTSKKSKRFNW